MATEPQANDQVEGQQEGQQPDPASQSEASGDQQQPSEQQVTKDTVLPDDHPLIVKHNELKAKLAKANTELSEARAKSAQTTKLEEQLNSRPTTEAMETLQLRFDRLEAFAQAVGLGKALDSRTFTRDLFETDKDIAQLVKEWNKANPTATSHALGSGGGR